MSKNLTLDQIREYLRDLPGPNNQSAEAARQREATLTKPPGALGRLEQIAEWLCAWQGRHPPALEVCRVDIFAGSHGVCTEGVSAFPVEVTAQMVANFQAGGAAINQLCNLHNCELTVHDVEVNNPTRNFIDQPAMTVDDCAGAMARGMEAVRPDTDLLCLGEMGIGNTTAAAALCHALYGGIAEDWVGPGTGVTGDAFAHKIRVVRDAVKFHRADLDDGLETLRRLGGRELAAMAGAIIAARGAGIPVLLDGYVCTAAAAVLQEMAPAALDHCIAGHVSAEPGHMKLLERLGLQPLLNLGMRLGEGSGAALAIGVLRGAVACHNGMGTFEQAGVSGKNDG